MTSYWAEYATLPGGLARDVLFEIEDGRFGVVTPDSPQGSAHRLPGLVIPGLANCHSHAFHRALRGRTHLGGGTFWTWRTGMYAIAERLDPDSYLCLATATYAEMALAGITAVGEFHYLHHQAGGRRYDDPNAMGEALIEAASAAGIRLTLLDTCYLAGGLTAAGHTPLEGVQLRFGDGDLSRWAERVSRLEDHASAYRVGGAMHSVRAVPWDQLSQAAWVTGQGLQLSSLHAHVSEQPAENEACTAYYGRTPTQVLHDAGLLESRFSAVHATHLTESDVRLLAAGGSTACFCPTTERDLADGIGPTRSLADAGVTISLGSDQHAVVDLIEEMRALESHERLASGERGRFSPGELLRMATAHSTLGWSTAGWDAAGRLEAGSRADLVAVQLDSTRTAGADPAQALQAASAADVTDVICDGEVIVAGRQHRLGDVGRLLADAINPLWEDR
ncbi:formimidoylglutamate deiminase [Flexivirga caeni]|uniref:Formimidoylglutamate deiminase n=1 Tax=Flexivirga caeni TaxID=2294115 RepID=A0A3M9M2V9_9MICO|nr:formimidoylglutamate deiminase [Flexivirga caeni]RNI19921.1 formimidoylglutamate deiminase [Flexivirga caeni]